MTKDISEAGTSVEVGDGRLQHLLDALGDDTFAGIVRTAEVRVPELRSVLTELLARRALIQPTPAETEGGSEWRCQEFVADPSGSSMCHNCGKRRAEHRSPTPPPIGDGEGELVARLRSAHANLLEDHEHSWWIENFTDAADAIEALRAERDALLSGERAVLPQTKEHAENLYTVAVACLKRYGVDPEAQVSTLSRQLEEAREALKPFVSYIEHADATNYQDDRLVVGILCGAGEFNITIGDLRRAKETVSHG